MHTNVRRLSATKLDKHIMNTHSDSEKLGGTCAILLGLSYLGISVSYLLQPEAVRMGLDTGAFMTTFHQHWVLREIYYALFGFGALLAFAVIPGIGARVRPFSPAVVQWMGSVAYLGFVGVALGNLKALGAKPIMSQIYVDGDEVVRKIIEVVDPFVVLDPQGWLGRGCVGLWLVVISALALRHRALPQLLAAAGVLVGVCYWLTVLIVWLKSMVLSIWLAGVLGLVVPIWYIWLGITLRNDTTMTVVPRELAAQQS
jgi:hypothetical protein